MKIVIAAVGRLKDGGEQELFERYRTRFDAAGRAVALGPVEIRELAESRKQTVEQRKADEATRLADAVPSGAVRVILDETGKAMSSEAFARSMSLWRDDGRSVAAFVVGGPDGHGPELVATAELKLSLGSMTLPHGLARVVLMEQLYRTATILAGHPYHRC